MTLKIMSNIMAYMGALQSTIYWKFLEIYVPGKFSINKISTKSSKLNFISFYVL